MCSVCLEVGSVVFCCQTAPPPPNPSPSPFFLKKLSCACLRVEIGRIMFFVLYEGTMGRCSVCVVYVQQAIEQWYVYCVSVLCMSDRLWNSVVCTVCLCCVCPTGCGTVLCVLSVCVVYVRQAVEQCYVYCVVYVRQAVEQ